MPRVRPLSPVEAKRTLAARFGPRADRLRQLNTRFGIRPYRVFLIWTLWTGSERGEGDEYEAKRVEILPTPKVSELTAFQLMAFSGGTLPVGSLRVSEISTRFTADTLAGRTFPEGEATVAQPYSFFYEVTEDGRADSQPMRAKCRLASAPFLNGGAVQWTIMLERISEDARRNGQSAVGNDDGLPPV